MAEWESFFELAGLRSTAREHMNRPLEIEPWLARAGCTGDDAARVRELLADRIVDGWTAAADARDQRSAVVAIVVDNDTRLVVQGLTGSEGRFHGLRNRAYGTNVVAGVTPGKGGQDVEGIPVFDTVADAVEQGGREHER